MSRKRSTKNGEKANAVSKRSRRATGLRGRRSGRSSGAKTTRDFDWSTICVIPASNEAAHYTWVASCAHERDGESPPLIPYPKKTLRRRHLCLIRRRSCGKGITRWFFYFPSREERNRFVEECYAINERKARRELTEL